MKRAALLLTCLLLCRSSFAAEPLGDIIVTATKPTPLKVALLQEPRAAFFGSEQIRFWYRLGGGRGPITLKVELRNRFAKRSIELGKFEANAAPADSALLADISSDRWAGEIVQARLIATDETGKVARSKAFPVALVRKTFLNALAARLAEYRQSLIDERTDVTTAREQIDALVYSARFNEADPVIVEKLRLTRLYLSELASVQSAIDLLWVAALDLEANTRVDLAQLAMRYDTILRAQIYAPLPLNAPTQD
jgi:hypothetical protein